MSHLLSLDRHDVLETIRKSNSLREAFLGVAKLPAAGEYHPCTNADRLRAMSDEELAKYLNRSITYSIWCDPPEDGCEERIDCEECILSWLKSPVEKEENK